MQVKKYYLLSNNSFGLVERPAMQLSKTSLHETVTSNVKIDSIEKLPIKFQLLTPTLSFQGEEA